MLLADAVERSVFICNADALIVDIAGKGILRAEQQRGDGEDPAATAEVEDLFPAVDMLLKRL